MSKALRLSLFFENGPFQRVHDIFPRCTLLVGGSNPHHIHRLQERHRVCRGIMFPYRFCAWGLRLWGLVLLKAQHYEVGSNLTQIFFGEVQGIGILCYMFVFTLCFPRQNRCPRETWNMLRFSKLLIHFSLGGFWDVRFFFCNVFIDMYHVHVSYSAAVDV